MIKSKLRDKILKLRKNYSKKIPKIKSNKIYTLLKKKNYNSKFIGGYFPSNHEIDDLQILNFFSKKGFIIGLPKIKKKKSNGFFQMA